MALTTDRISVLRGRPPVRAGGRKGFRTAHCWLVRSLGYGFGFIPFLRSRPPFWNRLSMMNQHRSGIDHLKTLPLGVALRAAAGLSTDGGQLAAGGRRMGQPRLEQESLYPPMAVAGKRAVPADQGQAIMDHQQAATGGLTVDAPAKTWFRAPCSWRLLPRAATEEGSLVLRRNNKARHRPSAPAHQDRPG